MASPASIVGPPPPPTHYLSFYSSFFVLSPSPDFLLWGGGGVGGLNGFFPFSGGAPRRRPRRPPPGFIDWLSLKEPAVVKIANWHARLNVIALLGFAASFYLRTTSGSGLVSGSYTIAIGLSVLGVILISISGYLGGEMVFKHGVAVDQQSGDSIASQ